MIIKSREWWRWYKTLQARTCICHTAHLTPKMPKKGTQHHKPHHTHTHTHTPHTHHTQHTHTEQMKSKLSFLSATKKKEKQTDRQKGDHFSGGWQTSISD